MRRSILFGSIVLFLSGCVGNPEEHLNCHRINWHRLGYLDGSNGNYRQNLKNAFPSCGSNIIVNRAQYRAGWLQGVKEYCLPKNGMRLGEEGKMYNNVCPSNQIGAFDKAWRNGLKTYCVPHNGYKLGLKGKDFPNFCPPNLNSAFHRAYRRGEQHYQQLAAIETKLNNIKSQLSQVHQERKKTQHLLRSTRTAYSHQAFSPQKQYQIQQINIKVKRLIAKEKTLRVEKEKRQTQYKLLKKAFLKMD